VRAMSQIVFVEHPSSYQSTDAFIAHLSQVGNRDELFRQLFTVLKLPDYFGYNWDALSDCLRDFHWIDQKQIVLVHDECLALDEQSLGQYLRVLLEAVQDWKSDEEHSLSIVFPTEFLPIVSKYVG